MVCETFVFLIDNFYNDSQIWISVFFHSWRLLSSSTRKCGPSSCFRVKFCLKMNLSLNIADAYQSWNSWNAYGCDVSEDKIVQAANYVVSLGLKDAGYEYVNIDDCWSVKSGRNATTHQIIPNATTFPGT